MVVAPWPGRAAVEDGASADRLDELEDDAERLVALAILVAGHAGRSRR